MAAVDANDGIIRRQDERRLGAVRKGYTAFRDNDVIIAKITPRMENVKAAIAKGLANGLGFGSTEFHVLRPEPAVWPEWLFYFVRRTQFRDDAKAHISGAVGLQWVPASFI